MNSIAKLVGILILIVFLSGVYVALSPGIFMKIGAKEGNKKITELRAQIRQYANQIDSLVKELNKLQEQSEVSNGKQDSLQNVINTLMKEKEFYKDKLDLLEKQHRDTTALLSDIRNDLDSEKEEKIGALAMYNTEFNRNLLLEESLKVVTQEVAGLKMELKQSQAIAAKSEAWERGMLIYRYLSAILSVLAVLLLTLYFNAIMKLRASSNAQDTVLEEVSGFYSEGLKAEGQYS